MVVQGFDQGKPDTVKGPIPEDGPQDGKLHGMPQLNCSVLDYPHARAPLSLAREGPDPAGRPDPHPPLSSLCLPPALASGS